MINIFLKDERSDMCKKHKPFSGGILAWYIWFENMISAGKRQTQCKKCKRWFFKGEF